MCNGSYEVGEGGLGSKAIAMALVCGGPAVAGDQQAAGLWDLAKAKQGVHRFSTLFTAQQVRDHLSTEAGSTRPSTGAARRP